MTGRHVRLLTAAELAAFLGITASGVRQIIRRNHIKSLGRDGRAKLYDPAEVLARAKPDDRIRPQEAS